ncbi:hypothetical protein IPA_02005 [Ignicoccus pacificus DSM 13166]|uniref:Uncharacterized protein n=1 Tax=Ignicoccus pacificus DSM 13166 TaxID=940294 RepID=A0A977KCJ1_9CREN|nr:hypothetical protein IPA_02005 [Ignicoccus pacificus DSM 13166]
MEGTKEYTPETIKILELLAYFYQTYFRSITFSALPAELEAILGDAAYGVIVRIVAGASGKAVPTMAKNMGYQLEDEDKLAALANLNKKCHVELYQETSKIKGLGDIGLIPVEYNKEKGRVLFQLDKCPKNIIAAAPFVGIVVGISRALGLKVTAIRTPEQKQMIKEGFVVYPILKKEEGKCYIAVERV